jgi:hypothetical protein
MKAELKTPKPPDLILRGGFRSKAAPRFELGDGGFADLCLTTWLCCRAQIFSIPKFWNKASI